jgi:hypothetical protein
MAIPSAIKAGSHRGLDFHPASQRRQGSHILKDEELHKQPTAHQGKGERQSWRVERVVGLLPARPPADSACRQQQGQRDDDQERPEAGLPGQVQGAEHGMEGQVRGHADHHHQTEVEAGYRALTFGHHHVEGEIEGEASHSQRRQPDVHPRPGDKLLGHSEDCQPDRGRNQSACQADRTRQSRARHPGGYKDQGHRRRH